MMRIYKNSYNWMFLDIKTFICIILYNYYTKDSDRGKGEYAVALGITLKSSHSILVYSLRTKQE